MTITMELYELKTLCANMAALGVATYQKEAAPATDLISQREAYRQFQEVRVKRWVENGLITPQRNGLHKIPNATIHAQSLWLLIKPKG